MVAKTLALAATVEPGDATYKTVQWTTSNAGVATVSDKGVVTAVGTGTAVITARAAYGATGSEKADFALTVTRPVESITLSVNHSIIKTGENAARCRGSSPRRRTEGPCMEQQ